MTAIDLKYPLGGLSENVSFTDQPPRTTQDEANMRGIDCKTGRIRGAQRAGTSKYLSDQNTEGNHAIKDLNFVVVNDKRNTYAVLGAGAQTQEWNSATSLGNYTRHAAIDSSGNVYALDGDAAFTVINPQGRVVSSKSIPLLSGTVRRIAVDVSRNVFVGTYTGGTQADARLWKFGLNLDGGYDLVWEMPISMQTTGLGAGSTVGTVSYVTAILIQGATIYVAIGDESPGGSSEEAEVHRYDNAAISTVAPSVPNAYFGVLFRANSIAVSNDGSVFVSSTHEAYENSLSSSISQSLIKYSGSGTSQWSLNDGSGGIGFDVKLTKDQGGVYTYGQIDTDQKFLRYFDETDGDELWSKTSSNGDFSLGQGQLAVDEKDNVYVPWGNVVSGPTEGLGFMAFDNSGVQIVNTNNTSNAVNMTHGVLIPPSRPNYEQDSVTIQEFLYHYGDTFGTITVNASTNATPIVVTTGSPSAHNVLVGDEVRINDHEVNTSANGRWTVSAVPTTSTLTLKNSKGIGSGINTGTVERLRAIYKMRLVSVTSTTGSQRSMVLAGVANGTIYSFTTSAWAAPNGYQALDTASDHVQSVAHFGKLYYVDGKNTVEFDPADQDNSANGEVKALVSSTVGEIPQRNKLIASWRGRLVLARDADDGHNWFMSARDDPTNWDYFPPVITATIAVAGNSSDVGRAPDIINTLIPWSDDLLIFGCDHSIWRLTGDPMDGGQIDQVPTDYGMAFGRPWTEGPRGEIYFFGSRGGVHVMTPSGDRQRISVHTIERRLTDVDLSKYNVRLVWNYEDEGLHVFLTERGVLTGTPSTGQATHYFWEAKTNSWHPDTFKVVTDVGGSADLEPASVMVIDGDLPADRKMLIGRDDGYVSKWDRAVTNDDNGSSPDHAIASSVLMGPFSAPGLPMDSRWSRFQFTLADDQNGCNFELYSSDRPDVKGSPKMQGTIAAGANRLRFERIRGQYVWLKLQNAATNSHWSFERAICDAVPAGRTRVLG